VKTQIFPASASFGQLVLLAFANMLAAMGGGRVLSATKGVTGLTVLGSGSLLAFLAGSAIGLGLLVVVRRAPLGQALAGLSIATVLSSITLIVVLWLDASSGAHNRVSTVWNAGQTSLSRAAAWLFFLVLVARYALWFAGRSLRADLASSEKVSWLSVTESAYFLGFIIGLLAGPLAVAGPGSVVGALLLDVVLLAVVAGCDAFQRRSVSTGNKPNSSRYSGENVPHERTSFWRLTAAFGAATIACQVVIFHCADVLSRTSGSPIRSWADLTVATFYLGVAVAAGLCARFGPTLERAGKRVPSVMLRSARHGVRVPLLVLVILAGTLILTGLFGIISTSNMLDMPASSARGALSLAAIASGAGLFELLVLTMVGRIRLGGNGSVALAFGLVVAAAAIALFLMMLSEMRFSGWIVTTATGLALTVWFVR
jgi:hypothetical protein